MIPPLFLDVEPHHKVFLATVFVSFLHSALNCYQVMDMCAAPGSKVR